MDLSQRAARGVALATLAVACVLVGPAPRLTRAFEQLYAVALLEDRRVAGAGRHRLPRGFARRQSGPGPSRPAAGRP
jgi:hypothetical protein